MLKEKKIRIQSYLSPCGELVLGSFEDKLCLCNWTIEKHPGRVDRRLRAGLKADYEEGMSDVIQEAMEQLDAYFRLERKSFDVPLLTVGTDFQQQVWRALQEILYGKTCSYGELAERIGHPNAVRAVANANGANAISLFIPCHRIIGSDRSLTGYGGGLEAKKFLLELEKRGK